MKLAVILVSYNTRDLLRQSLLSIKVSAHASGFTDKELSVTVVDNASNDGSAEMVEREHPDVHLMCLPENTGFTRANNIALADLGFDLGGAGVAPTDDLPDYVLLLNPDTELVDDTLGRMLLFMEEHSDAGACGARLEYADGSFQHGAFRFPYLGQVALDLFPVHRLPRGGLLYDSPVNGRYPETRWNATSPFTVDFVLGAALMMRDRALQQIGGLDEGYFMYCEEMDWCLRLDKAGLHTYAVPAARVIHHEAQSSRQTPWPTFERLWRSRLRFYTKHRDYFPTGHILKVRTLLRIAMSQRARQASCRFARGQCSGLELAEELAAYATVARL